MARQGWGGSIATAAGVAAGAGAAQLGFGYGLGILNWAPPEATVGSAAWVASLIWATWIAATSTIFGAVCAQRLHDRRWATSAPDAGAPGTGDPAADDAPGNAGGLWALALAVAAALGALITVLLVAVPARVAVVPDTPSPRNMAAGYAAVGVLIGALVAVWALRCRAAATNVIATAGWLWLLAVVAVVDSVLAGRGLTTAQLGIWQLSSDSDQFWIRDYFYWPGAILSLGSALLIGALAARRGVRAPGRWVGSTASGAAGPLLVAIAYFLAVPRLTAISPEQVSAHLIAPYAVIVGVGGSVLVAALAQRAARRALGGSTGATATVPRQRTGDGDRIAGEVTPTIDRTDGAHPRTTSDVDGRARETGAQPATAGARAGRDPASTSPASPAPASAPAAGAPTAATARSPQKTTTSTGPVPRPTGKSVGGPADAAASDDASAGGSTPVAGSTEGGDGPDSGGRRGRQPRRSR